MSKAIILVGLSGTGKTTVGMLLARALGGQFLDTDALVQAGAGRPIAEIFTESGEAAFRRLESQALAEALRQAPCVIATGGGIVEDPANDALLRQGTVVWLTGKPETLVERLAAYRDRPLLASDPLLALQHQGARRTQRYAALADWVVATDHLSPGETAAEIKRFIEYRQGVGLDGQHPNPKSGAPWAFQNPKSEGLVVTTPGGEYEVVVAPGALDQVPQRLGTFAPRGRAWIVSDDEVWPLHGERLTSILARAGIAVRDFQIPAGEPSKNLDIVRSVYDWLLQSGVERGDMLLAFGGGVVGDLAGFAAATVLRGIALVQLPTTVLAMVDSSIGGKTGVDHRVGKNLIGSFYQPRLVLADTGLLHTLPEAERQAGWTEAIKHGMIADADLLADLAAHAAALRAVDEPATSDLIRRAAAVKVAIVSGDEREQGQRILLNYGHTVGHALERWSNYTIRHGEAVAIGMCVAAAIARRVGLCNAELEDRQRSILQDFSLPVRLPREAEPAAILDAARSDKKVRQQRLNWVLPTAIGAATVRNDVPDSTVLETLGELRREH